MSIWDGARDFTSIALSRPRDRVAMLTLDRPRQRNAYTHALCDEVLAALDDYLRDDTLRCLIITGAGKAFCSGGDVSGVDGVRASLRGTQLAEGREMRDGMQRVILALAHLDKPVIAMINGPAVAGGLALALSCDIRIASDRALLGDTSGQLGLLPDEGGAWLFPRAMGLDRALRMTILAEVYDAAEALRLGLVTEMVAHDALERHTLALAERIAAQAPLAVRLAKSMMVRGLDSTLERSLGDARLAVEIANTTKDATEGIIAFLEKRKPVFNGN
ncbi:MAG: enoyl-CoA hydratase/isomerase family protein [Sphingomonas sp.]|uniref:enoyl-CoA hydratase/isomerase family protein n=1 Tax=Sphingomonas sp. TaxID=28214 RepID=UPI001AC4724F|nr:enoyl-CoA hydratase-related protein [Sphingomonas sp.]MBN8808714.1 enoyl-CoA hydratase/isomerase family protein [Sphingomonas sp.]